MTRRSAALGSILFLALAPGIVAGVIPWWITHWHAHVAWSENLIVGELAEVPRWLPRLRARPGS